MRTLLLIAATAIIVAVAAYFTGGYVTAKRLSRDTSYAQLLWLTAIDRALQDGHTHRAREFVITATDGTLIQLHGIDASPLPFLSYVAGGWTCDPSELQKITATRAKQHFLPISNPLSPESRQFLEKVIEVELPPKKNKS